MRKLVCLNASIAEAKNQMESVTPDVVISSVKFDNQEDGYQYCQEFKAKNPNKLFVFLTAATSSEEVMRGIKAGADDYLEKSIQPLALKVKLKSLIKRKQKTIEIVNSAKEKIQTTLEQHSFVDLLRMFESQNFTGHVEMLKGTETAKIEFENGLPKHIHMSDKTEDEAMDELLSWETGTVTIEQKTLKI